MNVRKAQTISIFYKTAKDTAEPKKSDYTNKLRGRGSISYEMEKQS